MDIYAWLSSTDLKFSDGDEPNLCRVKKVDVSSTFYWKYISVWVDPRQFLRLVLSMMWPGLGLGLPIMCPGLGLFSPIMCPGLGLGLPIIWPGLGLGLPIIWPG